jgi:TRAP-type C4-dicarboxylate transport system permease small subunit
MKNKETWIFAHTYIGRLWLIVGLIMLSVSVIIMLFFINKEIAAVGIAGGVVTLTQCIFMVLPILPAEIALKKNFNKDGSRKK